MRPTILARSHRCGPRIRPRPLPQGLHDHAQATSRQCPGGGEASRQANASLAAGSTLREQTHLTALGAWIKGDLAGVLALWEGILADHPTDVLAFRLAHFNNFWLGRPRSMRARSTALSASGARAGRLRDALACSAFAYGECGDYAAAERPGAPAVDIDPTNLWATHAVAHVMEMRGRHAEGIDWLEGLEQPLGGANNLLHHLWWHRAIAPPGTSASSTPCSALYDRRFRNLASALTQAQPDLYIDVQNAASMLFRLERLGVEVGERWNELADKAEQRIGDCLSPFTLPHWVMALTAAGR